MCANYRPPKAEHFRYFDRPQPEFMFGETYPGGLAPALTNFDPQLWIPACFGLVPGWAKDATFARHTYNARTETVDEKPSFRSAWKKRHFCIIPADCFYEPNYVSGKSVRWRIERADQKPFGIAGIWERAQKEGLPGWSMSMLTINADDHPFMKRFHKPGDEKRSIVILDDDEWDQWLEAKNEADVRAMLRLFEPENMIACEDPRGTKNANDSLNL